MKTAVQWLVEKLEIFATEEEMNIIDQAKDMEKQQIIDAHGDKLKQSGGTSNYEYWFTGEDYYNKTFKK